MPASSSISPPALLQQSRCKPADIDGERQYRLPSIALTICHHTPLVASRSADWSNTTLAFLLARLMIMAPAIQVCQWPIWRCYAMDGRGGYWQQLTRRRISRRRALLGLTTLGLGVTATAVMGC